MSENLKFKRIFYDGSLADMNKKISEARKVYGDRITLIVIPGDDPADEGEE